MPSPWNGVRINPNCGSVAAELSMIGMPISVPMSIPAPAPRPARAAHGAIIQTKAENVSSTATAVRVSCITPPPASLQASASPKIDRPTGSTLLSPPTT